MPKHAARQTDAKYRSAKALHKTYEIADGGGLSLRIQPNGSKLWMFRYRRPSTGKSNYMSIGPYSDVTAARAREYATDARRLVRDGIDPVVHRRAAKAEIQCTFEIVANKWLEEKRKGWNVESARSADQILKNHLMRALKHRSIATLSTPDVVSVIQAIPSSNVADKARGFIHAVIAYAVQKGLRKDGMPLSLNGIVKPQDKGHLPAITNPEKIGPLVRAIDAFDQPITRAALQLTLYTALRPAEIVSAKWEDMDLTAAEWRIPKGNMKGKRIEHLVSLPKQAVKMLKALQAQTGKGVYLFPTKFQRSTSHIVRDAPANALRKMGFQGEMTAHGFRAMLLTVANEELGIDLAVLHAQLAHAKRGGVEKAYNRTTYVHARREDMQTWADYIDARRRDPS